MRTTHATQRVAREIAEDRGQFDSGYDARAREIRAENARRANAVARIGESKPLAWLMRDVSSTDYATVIRS